MAIPDVFESEGLAVAAGGRVLIAGLGFSVARGAFVGIHGPSGCGKTTLLRALAGLAELSAGKVCFAGQPWGGAGWPHYRRQVVLVQQKPALLDLTVEKNLARPFGYAAGGGAFPAERAEALLTALQLPRSVLGQNALSLSVGQQQRVCLVRALLVKPAVLLLDEPTSALDAAATEAVSEVLWAERQRRGLAAVIAMHDRVLAQRLCGRSIDLRPYLVPAEAARVESSRSQS